MNWRTPKWWKRLVECVGPEGPAGQGVRVKRPGLTVLLLLVAATASLSAQAGGDPEDRARANTLKWEVRTLKQLLERNEGKLADAIEDARRFAMPEEERALLDRQRLMDGALDHEGRRAEWVDRLEQGEGALRQGKYENAVDLLEDARTGFHALLDDFAAAEFVLMIAPRVEGLRDRWRGRDESGDSAATRRIEVGYRQAVAYVDSGDLSEALAVYRRIAREYQALLAVEG